MVVPSAIVILLWFIAWLPEETIPEFLNRIIHWTGDALSVLILPAFGFIVFVIYKHRQHENNSSD